MLFKRLYCNITKITNPFLLRRCRFCEKISLKQTLNKQYQIEAKELFSISLEDKENFLTSNKFVLFDKEGQSMMELRKSWMEYEITIRFASQRVNPEGNWIS